MKAWEEIAQPLRFPIGGREYVAAEPSMELGVSVLGTWDGTSTEWQGRPIDELFRALVGDAVWDQMLADKVPATAMTRAGWTALIDLQEGREAAEHMWEEGPDPELLAALTAAPQEQTDSTTSTGTESGSATPSPASTRTMTSRPGARRPAKKAAPAKAPRSSGRTSSASGT